MTYGSNHSKVFSLHIRCSNCLRDSFRDVEVPQIDGAPSSIDDFCESSVLQSLRFSCTKCESIIGRLIGVTVPRPVEVKTSVHRLQCA